MSLVFYFIAGEKSIFQYSTRKTLLLNQFNYLFENFSLLKYVPVHKIDNFFYYIFFLFSVKLVTFVTMKMVNKMSRFKNLR